VPFTLSVTVCLPNGMLASSKSCAYMVCPVPPGSRQASSNSSVSPPTVSVTGCTTRLQFPTQASGITLASTVQTEPSDGYVQPSVATPSEPVGKMNPMRLELEPFKRNVTLTPASGWRSNSITVCAQSVTGSPASAPTLSANARFGVLADLVRIPHVHIQSSAKCPFPRVSSS
jgi:hypothetical protein